jgi:hypothetical protein
MAVVVSPSFQSAFWFNLASQLSVCFRNLLLVAKKQSPAQFAPSLSSEKNSDHGDAVSTRCFKMISFWMPGSMFLLLFQKSINLHFYKSQIANVHIIRVNGIYFKRWNENSPIHNKTINMRSYKIEVYKFSWKNAWKKVFKHNRYFFWSIQVCVSSDELENNIELSRRCPTFNKARV